MFLITTFIDAKHLDELKTSMFEAGGGHIGNYDSCSFETIGKGQFRPLAGANPSVGKVGEVHTLNEVRLEMVVEDKKVHDVVKALKDGHPYETPAYYVVKLEDF